jgi:aryl-phospho-beta-D-glucosidase BglC (GH1 family)
VAADNNPDPDETFTVTLSNPSGATLASAVATGTIHDSVIPLPTLSVSNASATEGVTVSGATGFFHTSGNQILDSSGNPVKIAGVNWFGFETSTFAPHGLDVHSYQTYLDQMKQLGFNTIRLPFCLQMFDPSSQASGINYTLNPDLAGLTPAQIMDKIVAAAGKDGLKIILDCHRAEAGGGPNSNGLWYDAQFSEQQWLSTWTMLATRYAGNPTVIGADLQNEPHGAATWGTGSPTTDWRLAAERAGNAILAVNPNWLIFVEGVESGPSGYYWWGGNLSAAGQFPVQLSVAGRLVYSAHDYPASVYNQPWFSSPQYPTNLASVWTANWGYLYQQNIAPVWLGEFGSTLQTTSDQQWLSQLVTYLGNAAPGQQGISWTWWSWNPDSGDTGGILQSDWTTPIAAKVNALKPIEFSFPATGGGGSTSNPTLTFTVSLSAASTTPVTVMYTTADGTAKAGTDYTAVSGTLTFALGQTSLNVSVPLLNDPASDGDETLSLLLSSPTGATIAQGTGTGTIHDSSSGNGGSTGGGGSTGSSGATVTFTDSNDWGTGFVGSVAINNTGSQPINGWTLEFDAPFQISTIWGGTVISHVGNHYVIQSLSLNSTIAPGASVSLGFQATPGGSAAKLANVLLNGHPA